MLATAAEPDTATRLETRRVRLLVHDDELEDLIATGRNLVVPDDDPKQPLHWRWVTDLDRTETLEQRRERYFADQRPVDMRGFAATICRAYTTFKDMKYEADDLRKVVKKYEAEEKRYRSLEAQLLDRRQQLRAQSPITSTVLTGDDQDWIDQQLALSVDHASVVFTPAEAAEFKALRQVHAQVQKAEEKLLTAPPVRRFRSGQSDTWYVCDGIKFGRRVARLNQWYEYERLKQTGRPKGSKTRNRRAK